MTIDTPLQVQAIDHIRAFLLRRLPQPQPDSATIDALAERIVDGCINGGAAPEMVIEVVTDASAIMMTGRRSYRLPLTPGRC
ncbi:hypothetical protein R80B4_02241 [Fibrobacteres bacterium R8-0-B4]